MDQSGYCCCQMFPLLPGLYFMAVHCMFHGMYGICLVVSSFYKKKVPLVNYSAIASSACFILIGSGYSKYIVSILWSALYNSWRGAKFCGCLISIVTLFNLTTFTMYFVAYLQWDANSLMDANLFWKNSSDWVGEKELPFTLWHVFTFCLVATTLVGWYYSFVLCKSAKLLKMAEREGDIIRGE